MGEDLRAGVRDAYSGAAVHPEGKHPFPVGRAFALEVGYPAEWLDTLPPASAEAFTGVSAVSLFARIPPGAVVLDLGCGAGLDALIAARRAGAAGRAIGVDFSESMLARAACSRLQSKQEAVLFVLAGAENLPLPRAAVDVALVNGIFNLNPTREAIFAELARVVKPGGQVFGAELILREPLPDEQRRDASNWFS
jgi:arsenite methyltransferase